jgi:hypothetical protein
MSVNLQLTANATGDNFTIVESGSVVNVYYNQPETGTPQSTTAVSDLSSITINGVGSDTVNVDESGGNPIPASLVVAGGAVTINQDLGTGGSPVDVSVTAGAIDFATSQHLNSLTVAAGTSANMLSTGGQVLAATCLAVGGVVNVTGNALVAGTIQPVGSNPVLANEIEDGATISDSTGVYSPMGITSTAIDSIDSDAASSDPNAAVPTVANLVVAPAGANVAMLSRTTIYSLTVTDSQNNLSITIPQNTNKPVIVSFQDINGNTVKAPVSGNNGVTCSVSPNTPLKGGATITVQSYTVNAAGTVTVVLSTGGFTAAGGPYSVIITVAGNNGATFTAGSIPVTIQ